ncbi:MAG: type II toxin-antitoxin system MqsR family toxin [Selenomonadaceae bacterium]|nr:type II toxin-antitoxin system MqsR family toxin [Selenomonadaceae bacterium]
MKLEKFNPSYSLTEFKNSDYRITVKAKKDARNLGLDIDDIREIVSTMELKHFYKSMTSYADHKIWQDVYHVPCGDLVLYVKFTKNILSEFMLLSFKEK